MSSFELRADYPGFRLDARAEWDAPCAALFGASGSGKTTVLEAIAGLRPEVTGTVVLGERRVDGLSARVRRVGWVPQDASLFPHLSVRENVEFATRVRRGATSLGSKSPAAGAIEALEIGELLERRASDLSGGERQRVAIARALASEPEILLLDEPLASIDRPLRARLLPFLERLPEVTGTPTVLVTHDPLEVLALASVVVVLEAGRVVTSGDPHEVFASAATFGALGSLGAENKFDVRVIERRNATYLVETAGGRRLSMVRALGFPEPTRVAIRAEDVMLAERDPGPVSAQNVFEARVVSVQPLGEQVLVDLEDRAARSGEGDAWRVKVTPRARETLSIEAGRSFVLLVKAHAIVPADGGASAREG